MGGSNESLLAALSHADKIIEQLEEKENAMVSVGPPARTGGRIEAPLEHVLEEIQTHIKRTILSARDEPLEALQASGRAAALLDLITTCGVGLTAGEETAIETLRTTLTASESMIARHMSEGIVSKEK